MKKLFISLAVFVLVGIGACSKKSSTGIGQFQVVNASAGFGPVDVYMDGSKFITNLGYEDASGYLPLAEGSHVMNFPNTGTTTSLFDVNLTTAANINQTMFVYGRTSSLQVFAVQDNLSSPGSNKAAVRFYQLCPDAPLLDFGTLISGTYTRLYTARSFENASTASTNSGFSTIDPGTYTFQAKVNGAGTTLLTAGGFTLEAGKIYTLYLSGTSGSPTDPLVLSMVVHN